MLMLTCEQEDIEGLTKKERLAKISKNNHIRSGAVTVERIEIFKKKVARRSRPMRSAKKISKLAGDVLELRMEGERRFRYLQSRANKNRTLKWKVCTRQVLHNSTVLCSNFPRKTRSNVVCRLLFIISLRTLRSYFPVNFIS